MVAFVDEEMCKGPPLGSTESPVDEHAKASTRKVAIHKGTSESFRGQLNYEQLGALLLFMYIVLSYEDLLLAAALSQVLLPPLFKRDRGAVDTELLQNSIGEMSVASCQCLESARLANDSA